MAVWDELSLTLTRLLEEQPGALRGYPDPSRSEGGTPPFGIRLAAWAETVAGELDERFGSQARRVRRVTRRPGSRRRFRGNVADGRCGRLARVAC